jgi:hypothetical protein
MEEGRLKCAELLEKTRMLWALKHGVLLHAFIGSAGYLASEHDEFAPLPR